jgi:hypothetical protein
MISFVDMVEHDDEEMVEKRLALVGRIFEGRNPDT